MLSLSYFHGFVQGSKERSAEKNSGACGSGESLFNIYRISQLIFSELSSPRSSQDPRIIPVGRDSGGLRSSPCPGVRPGSRDIPPEGLETSEDGDGTASSGNPDLNHGKLQT